MTEMSEIVLYLVIFLIGGIFGFMLCRITFGKKQAAAQQQELEESKAELENYKSQVNEHFTSSAELMEQVASSYQALYSHMAGQSQTLLGDNEMLPFAQLQSLADEKEQQAPAESKEVLQTDSTAEMDEAIPKRAEPETEAGEQSPESSAEKSETEEQTPESIAEKPETEERAPESSVEKPETEERTPESSAEKPETEERAPESSVEKPETEEQASESSKKDIKRSEEPSKTAQK